MSETTLHIFDPYEQTCERCGVSYKAWASWEASMVCTNRSAVVGNGCHDVRHGCQPCPEGEWKHQPTSWCVPCKDANSELVAAAFAESSPPVVKPPTLREWLGDRVGELGRWAEVLREQPVPAGWIEEWRYKAGVWVAYGGMRGGRYTLGLHTLFDIANEAPRIFEDGFEEALPMAMFTRHPDVKPEPKPAAFPWDPYPEVV